jgi:hypothetical protein
MSNEQASWLYKFKNLDEYFRATDLNEYKNILDDYSNLNMMDEKYKYLLQNIKLEYSSDIVPKM